MGELLQIPSRIWVSERAVFEGGEMRLVPVSPPFWKDYDSCPEDRLDVLPVRYDVQRWLVLVAPEEASTSYPVMGGIVVAGAGYEPSSGDGVAWVVDIRVAEGSRRRGVGGELWRAAEAWGRTEGYRELRVETQDVNVPACRFYARMGCSLFSVEPGAYAKLGGEARVIWRKTLLATSEPPVV